MGAQAYKTNTTKDSIQIAFIDVDAHFIELMGLKLVAGRDFRENPVAGSEQYIIVNEKMIKDFKLGSPTDAIGQKLLIEGKNVEVIGIVKDFRYNDITREIGAMVLRNRPEQFGYVSVKLDGKNAMATVAYLESEWKKVNPNTKFEYEFLDQKMLFLYSMFSDIAKVIGFLSFLAALVSCLGLLGMATYSAETRTKEIGVRKVLGASVSQIAFLLSKGFISLLLIAIVIATPIAYFMNNLWLEFFATRVNFGVGILGLGILIMLVISLLTVFSQTWRAARANPVESLKNE
jgi:putative ABC transport system permease protein